MLGMAHRQRQDTGSDPLRSPTIPNGALRPAAFAHGDTPGLAPVALRIQQLVVLAKAEYEAQVQGQQQTQPEGPSETLVEDMHNHAPPLQQGEQQLALLIASEGGMHTTTAPPAHRRQARRTEAKPRAPPAPLPANASPARRWVAWAGCSSPA